MLIHLVFGKQVNIAKKESGTSLLIGNCRAFSVMSKFLEFLQMNWLDGVAIMAS